MVTFKRPQLGVDEKLDQHIYSDGQQSVMWAIGPLNNRMEVSYHRLRTTGDMFVDFARTPKWNCPSPDQGAGDQKPSGAHPPPVPIANLPDKPKKATNTGHDLNAKVAQGLDESRLNLLTAFAVE